MIPQVLMPKVILKAGDLSRTVAEVTRDEECLRAVQRLSLLLRRIVSNGKRRLVVFWPLDPQFQAIERVVLERKLEGWFERQIKGGWRVEVHLLSVGKGGDFALCRAEMERIIHKLCIRFPFAQFGHLVGFGDSPLVSLLFLEGIRRFADRYVSIYWNDAEIHMEPTVADPPAETWLKQVQNFIIEHDYKAALEMLQDLEETKEKEAASHLLQMMIDRLNFAMEEALGHWHEAVRRIGTNRVLEETKHILQSLVSDDIKRRDLARIVELYRHLDMYLDAGNTVAFLVRFYRAREAVLYYLLQHAQTVPGNVMIEKKSTIYEVIEWLEEKYDQWEVDGYYGAYFYLKSLNVANALQVRNRSFIGHARSGINEKKLWHSYYGTDSVTMEKAKRRFIMDTSLLFRDLGVRWDENIMDVNRFLLQFISQLAKERKEAYEMGAR
ncbi:hypothetical protein GC56T2_2012 [Geobacillus sp. C56-T2]|nr:hypothetical protein GC56T2_2012 [Geobacillus sp. C56-T2]